MIARVVAEQVVESALVFGPVGFEQAVESGLEFGLVDFEPAAPGPFVEAD